MIESYPKTRKDWDGFLKRKYGYQLHQFENCFFGIQSARPFNSERLRIEIRGMKRLRKHIIKTMSSFPESSGGRSDESFIIEAYHLGWFFEQLEDEINWRERILGRESGTRTRRDGKVVKVVMRSRKKGHPPEIRLQILFVWAEAIKDESGGVDWKMILGLWDWFEQEYYDALKKSQRVRYANSLFKDDAAVTLKELKRAYRRAQTNKSRMTKIKSYRLRYFVRWPGRAEIPWTKEDAEAYAKYQRMEEEGLREFEKKMLEHERDYFLRREVKEVTDPLIHSFSPLRSQATKPRT